MPENNITQSTSVLGTPGDLIANIPGILGFYPTESVVLTVMFREGESTRHTLGPVVRFNIEGLDLLPDVGRAIESTDADLIFCFIITEDSTDEWVEGSVDTLMSAAAITRGPSRAC